MSKLHPAETFLRIIQDAYNRTFPVPSDAESYVYGFTDGASWVMARCKELAIEIPDADLFLVEHDQPGDASAMP